MSASTILAQCLAKIGSPSQQKEGIEELKVIIFSIKEAELKELLREIRFDQIVNAMQTPDREQQEICQDILSKLLNSMEPENAGVVLGNSWGDGLHHPKESIRVFFLSQLNRCFQKEEIAKDIMENSMELVQKVVQLLLDDSLAVATEAGKCLVSLAKTRPGLTHLFRDPLLENLKNLMTVNDTVRYRLFEVIASISVLSEEALALSSNSGLLSEFVKDLAKDDVLIQMNCIEMLIILATCQYGLTYLVQNEFVGKLEQMLNSSDPTMNLLIPGLVKFFGNVAKLEPAKVFEQNPLFVQKLFELFSTGDISHLMIAIDTVALVGTTVQGKLVLSKLGEKMAKVMKDLGSYAQRPPEEVRIRSMEAITTLLYVKTEDQFEDILPILEQWFLLLSEKPFEMIMHLCKQPFVNLRISAMNIFKSIANQMWGQRLMSAHPGFTEYLIDRSTENEKLGRDTKFDIIKILAESPGSAEIFGRPYHLKLLNYVKEGPFYVKAYSEVALESGGV